MLDLIKSNIVSVIISIVVSVITVLITEWFKKRGNLKIYIIEKNEYFYTFDEEKRCELKEEKFTDKTNRVKFVVTIDIYNNTPSLKTMRDIKFKILDNENIIIRDKDTENMVNSSYHIDELNNLNISPFTVIRKKFEVNLNRENYLRDKIFYLIYHNYNNVVKRVKIKK